MSRNTDFKESLPSRIDTLYRLEGRRIFATLVRLLGDFTLAEEALHDAFVAAMQEWPQKGIPEHPQRWLISAGRFKAIDRIRRQSALQDILQALPDAASEVTDPADFDHIEDDTLRLIFTCCHPSMSPETQIALTLREVCGLTTEEIAQAFLSRPATIAQRIVRGKQKIKQSVIPFVLPPAADLAARLDSVLLVIYLIFNEGYNASAGSTPIRSDLVNEAIRLARLLHSLLASQNNDAPARKESEGEMQGLLALMVLHHSRSAARVNADGQIVTLEYQCRDDWDTNAIREGQSWLFRALASGHYGVYTLQAAIAYEHCRAQAYADTDWRAIAERYGQILQLEPSPIISLNHAVAVSMSQGPAAGLALLNALNDDPHLSRYHLFYCARADLLRQLGDSSGAIAALQTALTLTAQAAEQRFIKTRILSLQ